MQPLILISTAAVIVAFEVTVVAVSRMNRRRGREEERGAALLREAELRVEAAERESRLVKEHLERVQQLDEAKNRFLADISHEFRTPLTVLMGPLSAWIENRGPRVLEAAGEAMHRNTVRMLRRINELLDLSKLESKEFVLHPEYIDVASLVRSVVLGFQPLAERLGVSLTVSTTPDEVSGLFDPDAME